MRFHVKLRRRREAKTDYQARTAMVKQDKNKYNTPKWRFVVRISNKNVTCQVVSSKLIGDEVLCCAYSHELPRYGLKVGLTNYAACYATGLLLARRLLKKVGMEDYEGIAEPDGEFFLEEADEEEEDYKNPFTCNLDVGLRRTTTGSRVFAAMKGATDGGLVIPHRENGKQFPGYYKDPDAGENYEADVCRKYIFGGHVGEYMEKLESENPDKYNRHFSQYIAAGVTADNMEEMYAGVHAAIRKDPAPSAKKAPSATTNKFKNKLKMSRAERRDHVVNKILARRRRA
jgi:large subunit ribosomal protein L5e